MTRVALAFVTNLDLKDLIDVQCKNISYEIHAVVYYLSIPKPGHRFAKKTVPFVFQGIEDTVMNVSPEARTKEILWKPMKEQSPRLTRR